MSSYATIADLSARYDTRILSDLITDSNVRGPGQSNLQAALDDATGLINSSALVGNRYSVSDLTALTGVDAAYLIRLCCDIAYIYLVQRRGTDVKQYPQWAMTQDELQRIRNGERIFNIASAERAGNVSCEFPSASQIENLDLAKTEANRFFNTSREQRIS